MVELLSVTTCPPLESILPWLSLVKKVSGVIAIALIAAYGVLAWQRFMWVTSANGWQYSIARDNLERITSLARLPDGRLLATLSPDQAREEPGRGQLIELGSDTRGYTILADKLYKPDGLLPYNGGVVVTQEFAKQPVMFWHDGQLTPLMMLTKPESLAITTSGKWLIVEDARNGKLVEIDPVSLTQTILYQGFEAGEGVCVGRDQRIFVVDNKRDALLEFVNGNLNVIADGLYGPGFLHCTPDGIWITEDVTNRGRLLYYDYKQLHVIARHLHSPQSALENADGSILVAEQGRSRLLRFTRQ